MARIKEVVLDTSAIIAVLKAEPEAGPVMDILQAAKEGRSRVTIPFLALMEVEYTVLRRLGPERTDAVLAIIESWPADIVESNPEWRHKAAQIKAQGGLSLADAWMAALSILSDSALVHKDKEFDKVADLRSVRLNAP